MGIQARTACVLQDSRFEVSKNGTLRINSVEVYDGTWYRCVSSTPAGSIEAQARVQVLGELECVGRTPCLGDRRKGKERQGPGPSGLPQPVQLPQFLLFPSPCPPSTETEKLKFTPPPRPQQCMEFDKEATVPCSATGREKPTIKWVRAGQCHVRRRRGAGRTVHWLAVCTSENRLCAQHHVMICGDRREV